jgi:hypothetical protein
MEERAEEKPVRFKRPAYAALRLETPELEGEHATWF